MMNLWIAILISSAWALLGWLIALRYYQAELKKLRDEVSAPITAPKFRVRTAESDPNRQSKVRKARIRAIIYRRPDPRK